MKRNPSDYIENLYREHRDFLVNYASRFLKKRDVAEDLVQITFQIAIKNIDTVLNHDKPVGWLTVVLQNLMKKHLDDQKRYRKYFVDYDPEWQGAPDVDPVSQLEAKDTVAQIRKLLGEEDFYLVKRLLYDEETHLVVSRALGISVAASRQRLSRALKKVSAAFPEEK